MISLLGKAIVGSVSSPELLEEPWEGIPGTIFSCVLEPSAAAAAGESNPDFQNA